MMETKFLLRCKNDDLYEYFNLTSRGIIMTIILHERVFNSPIQNDPVTKVLENTARTKTRVNVLELQVSVSR